ncbi:MAG: flippase [Opitutaceae bacterium]|nr:flippase [Opitutaceae bacterium]
MPPSDYLPGFIRARLEGRDTLRRAIGNSFWLFADQILRMVLGLVVGVWMARHLGPESFGWLNYAIAMVGVVGSLTSLGVGPVVVRELVHAPHAAAGWLGTTWALRAAGAAVGFLACVVIAMRQDAPAGTLILIVGAGLVVQVPEIVDLLFQARGESKVSAWVRMSACVGANVLKVGLILADAPLAWFAAAGVVELGLAAIGWWWAARRAGHRWSQWRPERARLGALLREGWPLTLSGFAITTQAYADQLVLGLLLGGEELGQYSAALRIVSVCAFVPMVVQTVAAPEIARAKRDDETLYRRRLHSLYRLMLGIFVLTAVPLVLLGPWAAHLLYGGAYAGAATLLPWLAFRLFFTNYGVARSIFVTNEGLFRFALVTSVAGAALNLALNFALVPHWGARGAIVASFASFALTIFGLEVFEARARGNLRLMLRAIFLPWRPFAA